MKRLFLTICFLLLASPVFATNYCNDTNNKGCWGMENSGNEEDLSSKTTTRLTETGGTIPTSSDKKFGTYSRDFESGDTEYLTTADAGVTDISGANQSISVCSWIKLESSTDEYEFIVSKYLTTGNQRQYLLTTRNRGSGHKAEFWISSDGTSTNLDAAIGNTTISDGSWYHACGVYNDTDIRVYVNGSLDSSDDNPKSWTAGVYDGTAEFIVGTTNNFSLYFDGLIDDVCIFNDALSSAEVLDIYINGCQGSSSSSSTRRVMLIE